MKAQIKRQRHTVCLITEGFEEASGFLIMKKVGMTSREIRKSLNSQVLTVFFAPLITAGIHTAFAMPILIRILRIMYLYNTALVIGVAVATFVVFSIFCAVAYKITSNSYFKIVNKQ